MSLLGRSARPLARAERRQRDDRLFLVLTDDTYAPKQYLEAFRLPRVTVQVFGPTGGEALAAEAVVARMKELRDEAQRRNDALPEDEFWLVLDTDHYVTGSHVAGFSRAIKEAREANLKVAITNPCFELWLLIHFADPVGRDLKASDVEDQLRQALGGSYNKTNVPTGKLLPQVEAALTRARGLDEGGTGWPQQVGTQVHRLVELLLAAR